MAISWAQVLYCEPKRFGAIWGARAACTQVLVWFLNHCGRLEEARKLHWFPHRYRAQVLSQDPAYRQSLKSCDVASTPFIKVFRDPFKRAVSSYHSVLRQPRIARAEISEFLGRPITDKDGFSFNEFLSYLEAIN